MKEELLVTSCPNCGFNNESTVLRAIEYNSESFERLLRGDLNVVICFQCASEYYIPLPLYCYIKEEKSLILLQEDFDSLNKDNLKQLSAEIVKKSLEHLSLEEDSKIRIVTSRNSFIEKVFLSTLSLNDKVIEYLKLQLYRKERDFVPEHCSFFYDYGRSQGKFVEFIVVQKDKKNILTTLQIQKEIYLEVLSKYEEGVLELDRVFPRYLVDVQFLLN